MSQAKASLTLAYELCPGSPFFSLPLEEQPIVMDALLRQVVNAAGGGKAGIRFLKQWAKRPGLPVLINDHYLTERAAHQFMENKLLELPSPVPALTYALGPEDDCRKCTPKPPDHGSFHSYYVEFGGQPKFIEVETSAAGVIRAPLVLQLLVTTKLGDPHGGGDHHGRRRRLAQKSIVAAGTKDVSKRSAGARPHHRAPVRKGPSKRSPTRSRGRRDGGR